MSYWACYIVRERERTRVYAHRWGARYICCQWLFWGPDVLPAMISALEPEVEGAPPDWAEGGMAVDLDAKSLVWFCEAPVDDCLSTIEALLPLQRVLWPGWSVQWAARGLDDLLLAAGLPARRPNFEEFEAGQTGYRQLGPGGPVVDIAERYELAFAKMIAEPTEETFGVASLRGTDGSRKLYPLGEAGIESILEYGPGRTIRALEQRLSHPSVTLSAAECSAQAGFDIDAQGRVLSLWSSDQIWTNHFRKVWEGWTIVDWGTDYGAHQTLLDGRCE